MIPDHLLHDFLHHLRREFSQALLDGSDTEESALRAQLLEWAQLESLQRILVSHGAPIEHEPAQALRDLAASLK